jgi:hypothetical protein
MRAKRCATGSNSSANWNSQPDRVTARKMASTCRS